MPQVMIKVGGRDFKINCGDGEEEGLHAAAMRLDSEIEILKGGEASPSGNREILIAGLMLADRLLRGEKALEVERSTLTERESEIKRLKAAAAVKPPANEGAVFSDSVNEALAEIAARTESLAASLEKMSSGSKI
ncbi:MAG: cell division protein ZapA [Aestuariivita sp.]|nr:cell division protein ZapA [Aestuariivita sp.]